MPAKNSNTTHLNSGLPRTPGPLGTRADRWGNSILRPYWLTTTFHPRG